MLKKLLILYSLSILSFQYTYAGIDREKKPDYLIYTDTTAEKKEDSLIKAGAATDPKQGFKDLFVAATRADGVTMEQLNPMAVSFVEDYIEKFGKKMANIKSTGKPYFDMMDVVLTEHGLPKELKYLAVIESYLQSNARSWAGAVGPWQLMPVTARNLGLRVNRKIDERKDLYKSTHAASRYLTSLFELYGDWLLVIAAYNGGPGAVNSAIRRSGSRDFWELQRFLPTESRNHVKKFIATHYIMEGEGGVTTLTKTETANRFLAADTAQAIRDEFANTRIQAISGRYLAEVISRYLSIDVQAFNKLNPNFDESIAEKGTYQLRLPNEKMDLFLTRKYEMLYESIQIILKSDDVSKAGKPVE